MSHDEPPPVLARVAGRVATPCFLYLIDDILARGAALRAAFDGRVALSYAVKANPNRALLSRLLEVVDGLDASSAGEVDRAIGAGCPPDRVSFSGPGKSERELRHAVTSGCRLVVESEAELRSLQNLARQAGRRPGVLIRISPSRLPRAFGLGLAGRPSQFGIDEEVIDDVLSRRAEWPDLDVVGFHIFSGSNCLSEDALDENFGIQSELFQHCAERLDDPIRTLVFGAGFGIPYHPDQEPLALERLAPRLMARMDRLGEHPRLRSTARVLELGRFLVGPPGYFLTRVIATKSSRGTEFRICDGGFNAHLAACGMMGTVIRRNWRMWKVGADDETPDAEYTIVGPLCTSFDTLAMKIQLPVLEVGDLVAVGASGAYGPSASPNRFISHPQPHEYFVTERPPSEPRIEDISHDS